MTENEILERQVEALEKLLQIKEAIIQEQETKIGKLEMERIYYPKISQPQMAPYIGPPINVPSVWTNDPCTDNAGHDYMYPWHGTQPQPCKKCGKVGASQWTITSCSTAKIDDGTDFLGTITDIANKKNV